MALGTPNWSSDSCSHQLDHVEDWQSGVLHMLSCACMHTTSILYSQMAQKHYWEAPWHAVSLHAGGASALPCRQASTLSHARHSYADLKLPDCHPICFCFSLYQSIVVPPRYNARSCLSGYARCTDASSAVPCSMSASRYPYDRMILHQAGVCGKSGRFRVSPAPCRASKNKPGLVGAAYHWTYLSS